MCEITRLFATKRCRSILVAAIIIIAIGSCTNDDPIGPDQFSDQDSLSTKGNSDTLVQVSTTDTAFHNANGRILNAVCYGPFRKGKGPGSTLFIREIKEDLLIMSKHWDAIRLYTTDANAEMILRGIENNKIDLKVMLGVWISGQSPVENAQQVKNAIKLANKYPGIVQAISCGNEIFGLHGSDIFVSDKKEIIGYLNDIKQQTVVPVTINDLYFVWADDTYSEVVDALDFLTVHLYGQWFNISLENTIPFIDEVVQGLRKKYPDKEIVIGETGWTTSKRAGQFGPVADEASQKRFYTECKEWSELSGATVFYFEAFDELWKGNTSTEAETNWGFYYEDRTPKLVFQTGQ